jgi:hypothetical protein
MATYYKYAERKASDEINWAEVGKDLTDMLKEENKIRVDKKAKIDEDSRLFGETLANAPTGESSTLNTYALKFGDDAQQARLLQDRLLKSGQLKLRDYNIMRQNLTDGTKAAFDYVKEYQQVYKEKMDRALAGQSQQWEQELMKMNGEMLDFANTALYINPTNYQVSVGKKNKDGSMSTNPNDFHNINDLRNYTKQNYDYFNSDEATTKFVDGLGDYQTIEQVYGGISILSDTSTRQGQNFDELMRKRFESFGAGNPFNFTSILTNDIGGYGFTMDANEAAKDPTKILMKKTDANGPLVPDFSTANGQKQKEAIYEHLKIQTISKIDTKRTYTQKQRQDREYDYTRGDKVKEVQSATDLLFKIYGGTEDEVDSAIQALRSTGNIIDVARNKKNGTVTIKKRLEDGGTTEEVINISRDKNGVAQGVGSKNFVVAALRAAFPAEFLKGVSEDQYLSQDKINRYGNLFTGGEDEKKATRTETAAATTAASPSALNYSNISSLVNDSFAVAGSNEATKMADALQSSFGDYGFSFEPVEDDFGFTDNVIVTLNGQPVGTFPVDSKSDLLLLKQELEKASKGNVNQPAPANTPAPANGGAGNSGGKARGDEG